MDMLNLHINANTNIIIYFLLVYNNGFRFNKYKTFFSTSFPNLYKVIFCFWLIKIKDLLSICHPSDLSMSI